MFANSTLCRVALVLGSVAFGLAGFRCGVQAQTPAGSHANVAYDEIARFFQDATPPPPGSFQQDAARIAALPPLPDSKPMGRAIDAAVAAGSNPLLAMTGLSLPLVMAAEAASSAYSAKMSEASKVLMLAGVMRHVWYYRSWSRVESDRDTVIAKPDRGLLIELYPAQHSYREVHTASSAGSGSQIDSYALDDPTAVGAITYTVGPSVAKLPPMMLSGHVARGYQTDAGFSLPQTLGMCSPGDHVLREVEYVIDVGDPQAPTGPPIRLNQAANEACSPTMTGSHYEPGHLVVFHSTSLTGTQSGKATVIVLERGNVRRLESASEDLFSIPTGYTKE
jgi:hypothetical protein